MVAFEPVDAIAAVAPNRQDAGGFEHVEMACRCRPTVTEAAGQVSGRQLRTVMGQEKHDLASRRVGERFEGRLDLDKRRLPSSRSRLRRCHRQKISAQT